MQFPFRFGEVRWRSGLLTADDRRIVGVSQYLDAAPSGDFSGATGVVIVEMREDKPIDVYGLQT